MHFEGIASACKVVWWQMIIKEVLHATLWVSTAVPLYVLLAPAAPLELPKEEKKCILIWRRTHKKPPGGTVRPFLSRSKEGLSNRIREHTGALKESSSLSVWVNQVLVACSHQVFCFFPFLSASTANSVVSRGMTKCVNVGVFLVFTMGHQKIKQGTRGAATPWTLSCIQTHPHKHAFRHIHYSSDRPG